jgi:rare lipoprotein A
MLMRNFCRIFIAIFLVSAIAACGGPRLHSRADAIPKSEPYSKRGNPESYVVLGRRYFLMRSNQGYVEKGIASWYGKKFHGRDTSSGERYDMYAMTAAHKTLLIPTYVRVTNLENKRSIVVRVNDRGPFHQNRIIDLSYAAAEKLDMVRSGTALVEVRVVGSEPSSSQQAAARSAPKPAASPAPDWRDESHLRNRIYVQVGAFSLRQNADVLRDRLLQARFSDIQILDASEQGGVLHRVRIGPLHTVAATDSVVVRLESQGFAEHQVIIE